MTFGESLKPVDQRKLAEFAAREGIGEYQGEIYALQLEAALVGLKDTKVRAMPSLLMKTKLFSSA